MVTTGGRETAGGGRVKPVKLRGISWLIYRYLFKETLFAFIVCFGFYFFIFFVNQLLLMAQEILTKKVPVKQVTLLIIYAIPSIIAISAPFAALLGTLMTIGRLSSDNEILVMLASGLSYKNILLPAIAVGLLVSTAAFLVNDMLLPVGTIRFNRLYRRILVSTPALELESNSVKRFKGTTVVTGNVSGSEIADVMIIDRTGDGERRVILAKDAVFRDAGREGLALDLSKAFVQTSKEVERRDYDYMSTETLRYRIPAEDLMQAVTSIGPREMSSRDVYKEVKTKKAAVALAYRDRAARTLSQALSLENSLRRGPSGPTWTSRKNLTTAFENEFNILKTVGNDRSLSIYMLEFYKKFSIPAGAFSLIILAIPLGLLAKKNGQTVGMILGLILSVFYWALLLGGQNMGIRLGYSPFWTMWIPDILAVGIGSVMLLFRVRK